MNSKNRLQEFLQNVGYMPSNIRYHFPKKGDQPYRVRIEVYLNHGVSIVREGTSQQQVIDILLDEIKKQYPVLCVNWEKVKKEAQAGDALIKLSAYLSDELVSSQAKSLWLQKVESDANLEAIFDRLFDTAHPSVAMFGWNLGKKHKATWIEALIWRRFTSEGITPSLKKNLQVVYEFLE